MTPSSRRSSAARVARPTLDRQERLRFSDFALERTTAGVVTCKLALELGDTTVRGQAVGNGSAAGDSRLGAQAALHALEVFSGGELVFELIGVRVVRAFDANVVIISLVQHSERGREKLLGCYLAEDDPVRGAALAVLNATNRVVSSYIVSR